MMSKSNQLQVLQYNLPLPLRLGMLLVCLLLFHLLKPCGCSGTGFFGGEDQLGNYHMSSTFDQLPGFLHLLPEIYYSRWEKVWGGLASYIGAYYPNLSSDDPGSFFTRYPMPINGRSFSVLFTMSVYQPYNLSKPYSSLFFFIVPAIDDPEIYYGSYPVSIFDTPFYAPSYTASVNGSSGSGSGNGNVSVEISDGSIGELWVKIDDMELPAGPGNSSVRDLRGRANNYSVWVDYDHVQHNVLVYVATAEAAAAAAKPADPIATLTPSSGCTILPENASLGFLSSVGQLVQLHTLNTTVIRSSDGANDTWNSTWTVAECYNPYMSYPVYIPSENSKKTVILSSVLGSAAATAVTAAAAYLYFNSRQRRWKKEQDRLTKIMRSLPGVPTQVDFSDIKKATKNFHETTKLGRGGFGSVYRCTLPAAASATGKAMEVAVKKFTREVEDRRYDDFLAEVSIINRLRHKNIVPLVGWAYNKGEPLLIYEFMTNGSLDQHLFQRRSTGRQRLHQRPPSDTKDIVFQWQTRYDIVRDIATGLHYVHNEHEPMVLHRDIKASNIMLDSNFRARLGDFGIACTVAFDRTSATGIAGTFGYMAPEYVVTYKATRQTDIYAFGVLILEIITGNKNADVPADDSHITLWVRRLHREGKLLEAVDSVLVSSDHQMDSVEDVKRLLLLGLACTDPNSSNRPSMEEVVQVISKVAPPPDVCLEGPMLFGFHEGGSSSSNSNCTNPRDSLTSMVELVQVSHE